MTYSEQLTEAIRRVRTGLTLVVTGAGISRASGIPTFRGSDPGAIWKESDVSMATVDYFRRDPVGQWQWYLARFRSIEGAEPNPAHEALVHLEGWQTARDGDFCVVTQNIDTLHERAGSKEIIKVHGTSDRLRCAREGCENGAPRGSLARSRIDLSAFEAEPRLETVPRCPLCQELLRAHVLFFDEAYQDHRDYRFAKVQRLAARADLLIFVGTSFSVGVTDLIVQAGLARRKPIFSIDPHAAPLAPWLEVTQLAEPAEELLPAVAAGLAAL